MTFYTLEEVGSHNTKESCWLVANNIVYDATAFINRHPAVVDCVGRADSGRNRP